LCGEQGVPKGLRQLEEIFLKLTSFDGKKFPLFSMEKIPISFLEAGTKGGHEREQIKTTFGGAYLP
jgi:hypothetical protein